MNRAVRLATAAVLFGIAGRWALAQEYKPTIRLDDPDIQYAQAPVSDPASRLDGSGGLVAILERLHISRDSQMLVFSKTSVQASRVSPEHPRAIYFNDNAAVAFVPGAPQMEIVAVDPALGPVFYTLPSSGGTPVRSRPETCLACHDGPNTAGVPGLYVGSVIPDPTGAPLRDDATAVITDHRTPFRDRWGGWYVTARHGEQRDRANATTVDPAEPERLVRESRQNVPTLTGTFDTAPYLTSSSDIVALMTFEHQTQATNLMTRVAWEARIAAREPEAAPALDADVKQLAGYLLFSGEAPLAEPVEGTSSFAATFTARGPRDPRGRSLRDFDLRTRLFRYRLSYLIYSAHFDALPDGIRERLYRALFDGLRRFPEDERTAIVEILRATKPALPAYWR